MEEASVEIEESNSVKLLAQKLCQLLQFQTKLEDEEKL